MAKSKRVNTKTYIRAGLNDSLKGKISSTIYMLKVSNRTLYRSFGPIDLTAPGLVCNFDDRRVIKLDLQNEFEALGRHVPSFDHPFFVLLDKNHRHDSQRRFA
jgi:hypothetical protein